MPVESKFDLHFQPTTMGDQACPKPLRSCSWRWLGSSAIHRRQARPEVPMNAMRFVEARPTSSTSTRIPPWPWPPVAKPPSLERHRQCHGCPTTSWSVGRPTLAASGQERPDAAPAAGHLGLCRPPAPVLVGVRPGGRLSDRAPLALQRRPCEGIADLGARAGRGSLALRLGHGLRPRLDHEFRSANRLGCGGKLPLQRRHVLEDPVVPRLNFERAAVQHGAI
mmetsp:Transcript_99595/g.277265  ORF Transcript_99595/g.277265 Transcript_99595/m.277265 type:complete len:223 (-) Transcript_99595:317-985(-)